MVGMTFSSLQDINVEYYKNYARYLGFGIGKISSKIRDDEKKKKKYFTLPCCRPWSYMSNSKNLLKPNPITRTQCKSRVNACVSRWNNNNMKSCY